MRKTGAYPIDSGGSGICSLGASGGGHIFSWGHRTILFNCAEPNRPWQWLCSQSAVFAMCELWMHILFSYRGGCRGSKGPGWPRPPLRILAPMAPMKFTIRHINCNNEVWRQNVHSQFTCTLRKLHFGCRAIVAKFWNKRNNLKPSCVKKSFVDGSMKKNHERSASLGVVDRRLHAWSMFKDFKHITDFISSHEELRFECLCLTV